jgi:hypothetical protein
MIYLKYPDGREYVVYTTFLGRMRSNIKLAPELASLPTEVHAEMIKKVKHGNKPTP